LRFFFAARWRNPVRCGSTSPSCPEVWGVIPCSSVTSDRDADVSSSNSKSVPRFIKTGGVILARCPRKRSIVSNNWRVNWSYSQRCMNSIYYPLLAQTSCAVFDTQSPPTFTPWGPVNLGILIANDISILELFIAWFIWTYKRIPSLQND